MIILAARTPHREPCREERALASKCGACPNCGRQASFPIVQRLVSLEPRKLYALTFRCVCQNQWTEECEIGSSGGILGEGED